MSATFTWSVISMTSYPQAEGQVDVVFQVNWMCSGTEGSVGASNGGVAYVTYTAGSPYTPYDQLTQEQVLGWVYASGVDQAAVEASVQMQIDERLNPPTVNLPLPWAPTPTP